MRKGLGWRSVPKAFVTTFADCARRFTVCLPHSVASGRARRAHRCPAPLSGPPFPATVRTTAKRFSSLKKVASAERRGCARAATNCWAAGRCNRALDETRGGAAGHLPAPREAGTGDRRKQLGPPMKADERRSREQMTKLRWPAFPAKAVMRFLNSGDRPIVQRPFLESR